MWSFIEWLRRSDMPRYKVTLSKQYTITRYREVVLIAEDEEDAERVADNIDHYSMAYAAEEDSGWDAGSDEDETRPEVSSVEYIDDGVEDDGE
jgi:hypothetical protein